MGAESDDEVYGLLLLRFSFRTICEVKLDTPEKTERQTPQSRFITLKKLHEDTNFGVKMVLNAGQQEYDITYKLLIKDDHVRAYFIVYQQSHE